MPMAGLYAPKHRARVFPRTSNGEYVEWETGKTIDGELQPASVRAQMQDGLIVQRAIGTYFTADGDLEELKVGDRLLVDGNFWQVVTEPSKRNAQPYLGYASCGVEKVGR